MANDDLLDDLNDELEAKIKAREFITSHFRLASISHLARLHKLSFADGSGLHKASISHLARLHKLPFADGSGLPKI